MDFLKYGLDQLLRMKYECAVLQYLFPLLLNFDWSDPNYDVDWCIFLKSLTIQFWSMSWKTRMEKIEKSKSICQTKITEKMRFWSFYACLTPKQFFLSINTCNDHKNIFVEIHPKQNLKKSQISQCTLKLGILENHHSTFQVVTTLFLHIFG